VQIRIAQLIRTSIVTVTSNNCVGAGASLRCAKKSDTACASARDNDARSRTQICNHRFCNSSKWLHTLNLPSFGKPCPRNLRTEWLEAIAEIARRWEEGTQLGFQALAADCPRIMTNA